MLPTKCSNCIQWAAWRSRTQAGLRNICWCAGRVRTASPEEDDIRQRIRDGAAVLQEPRTAVFRRLPRLAWMSLAAAVCMIVFAGIGWQSLGRRAAPASVILLQATRGTEGTSLAAPAGRPLIVVLDVTGLQQFPGYKLEIVDAAGMPCFTLPSRHTKTGRKQLCLIASPPVLILVRCMHPAITFCVNTPWLCDP